MSVTYVSDDDIYTTNMKIPFILKDSSGNVVTAYTSNVEGYMYFNIDGVSYSSFSSFPSGFSKTLTCLDESGGQGTLFLLTINYSSFDYIVVTIEDSSDNAVTKRIVITPSEAGGASGSTPSTADIATAVWNYGNTGTSLTTRTLTSSSGSYPTVSEISTAVWNAIQGDVTKVETIATAVWNYSSTRSLTTASNISSAVSNAVWEASTRTLTTSVPTVSDIADAVWGRSSDSASRTLTTPFPTVPDTSAISTAVWGAADRTLTTSFPSVSEIQSGLATPTTIANAQAAIIDHGDSNWTGGGKGGGATAEEIWTYSGDKVVTIEATQAATMVTARGFATPENVTSAKEAVLAAIPTIPTDYAKETDIPDISGLATSKNVSDAQSAIIDAMPSIPEDYAKSSDIPDISGLATSSDVSDAKEDIIAAFPSIDTDEISKAVWNYSDANPEAGVLGTRTLSTAVEVNPVEIARAVWNYSDETPETGVLGTRTLTESFPTSAAIASAVLTTNVAPLTVDTKEYTIKHLIMATQRSYVTEGESPHWVICAGDVDSQGNLKDITLDTIIATRTLTLNGNGAIVKTE